MAEGFLYLDASALVKLVLPEAAAKDQLPGSYQVPRPRPRCVNRRASTNCRRLSRTGANSLAAIS